MLELLGLLFFSKLRTIWIELSYLNFPVRVMMPLRYYSPQRTHCSPSGTDSKVGFKWKIGDYLQRIEILGAVNYRRIATRISKV